ncbi:MAG TPA: hypothetical protein VHC22_10495 [Pirellulales bacterium]|nr:hypothetical protein [Pirellulales bacterium]
MEHLYFVRSRTAIADDNYYESKTDVWMFGDKQGFDYFLTCLSLAKTANRAVQLTGSHPNEIGVLPPISSPRRSGFRALRAAFTLPTSMPAVVLPPRTGLGSKPRLKLCERLVYKRRKPAMELIIYGNRAAYTRLATIVRSLSQGPGVPLRDHRHLDDVFDTWVVKRSVALNIRAPLSRWSRANLGEYRSALYAANPHRLPNDLSHLEPRPYELPDADSPYLRL